MTTMQDLYPGGAGYHDAHEAYIGAVAEALANEGFPVDDWSAEPNDPRDGFASINVHAMRETHPDNPIWSNDEVNVAWTEDRGWCLVTVEESHRSNGRYVYDLLIGRVASPANVASEVAEKVGDGVSGNTDDHPDLDFPEHTFEDDDVPFELALRHYGSATASIPMPGGGPCICRGAGDPHDQHGGGSRG